MTMFHGQLSQISSIYTVYIAVTTLSAVDQFSQLFGRHKLEKICNTRTYNLPT